MTRSEKQIHQEISRKCRFSLKACLVIVLILGLSKMILINRASTWGHDLYSIKQKTDTIKHQNLSLKTELVKLSGGLDSINLKAQKLGFTDKPKIKYFPQPKNVAQVLP